MLSGSSAFCGSTLALAAVVVTGCSLLLPDGASPSDRPDADGIVDGDSDVESDGDTGPAEDADGAGDAGAGCLWESMGFAPEEVVAAGCRWVDDPDPPPPMTVEGHATLDTDACDIVEQPGELPGCLVPAGAPEACVVVVGSFGVAFDARLRVRGSLPLVVVSSAIAAIGGTMDLSGRGPEPGPAGSFGGPTAGDGSGRGAGAQGATDDPAGDGRFGGGGGGGNAGFGGAGGAPPQGGEGGESTGSCELPELLGGSGGGGGGGAEGGRGGGGGGVLFLLSSAQITVQDQGAILAAGGSGGSVLCDTAFSGAGGGGAGGTIVLDAPFVTVAGDVNASGGDGGSAVRGGAGSPGGGGDLHGEAGSQGEACYSDGSTDVCDTCGGGGGGAAGRVFVQTTEGLWVGAGSMVPNITVCTSFVSRCD